MNSIIEAMYGGGGKPVSSNTQPGKPASGSGYYSTFGYYDDLKNNRPPPTADQGGPTALEIAQHEGYADEKGMLSNGMNAIVAAMYGGGIAPISSSNNSMNPAYGAAVQGDTMGGIGNTDAWGFDINWSTPDPNKGTYGTLGDGDTFQTPAGDYQVSKNPWGQYVLVPAEGAIQGNAPYMTNFTNGEHHIGINPETGEVWYQQAAGYTNYSLNRPDSYYENPNGPGYEPPGNGGGNSGPTWKEILNNDGLAGEFPASSQERSSMDSRTVDEGLFKGLGQLDVYERMLKNLGMRG